ncbi:MAG TPA: flagellar hook capping FlgD N-terminal domain-containing protein [Rhizomicrobium sp.]|jgi:flagellar basal-body rod modification protein FlgD|nr:flagellar hook capping FlgD N-terminal domain-containing protein [Rhizomicrobium sp.]
MTIGSTTNTPTTTPTTTPATNANGTTNGSDAFNQLSGNFSTFLTLLTTQLKNQDPTSPMDSNQFTQQLVEYSQVEQQIDTNTNLQSLITQGTSNAAAVTTSYLGKNVSVTNGNASLSDGAAAWTYNLGAASATTQLTVTNSSGTVVYTGAGSTTAGNNSFNWNGQDNNGNQLNDGTYKLTVTATDSSGNAITSSVASAGTVSQIDMTSGTPMLVIGNMEVNPSAIAAVGD